MLAISTGVRITCNFHLIIVNSNKIFDDTFPKYDIKVETTWWRSTKLWIAITAAGFWKTFAKIWMENQNMSMWKLISFPVLLNKPVWSIFWMETGGWNSFDPHKWKSKEKSGAIQLLIEFKVFKNIQYASFNVFNKVNDEISYRRRCCRNLQIWFQITRQHFL